jgi:hypothetical protein
MRSPLVQRLDAENRLSVAWLSRRAAQSRQLDPIRTQGLFEGLKASRCLDTPFNRP